MCVCVCVFARGSACECLSVCIYVCMSICVCMCMWHLCDVWLHASLYACRALCLCTSREYRQGAVQGTRIDYVNAWHHIFYYVYVHFSGKVYLENLRWSQIEDGSAVKYYIQLIKQMKGINERWGPRPHFHPDLTLHSLTLNHSEVGFDLSF